MQKTAIFGGTFSPPHKGHIAMLRHLSSLKEIEKILIMPSKTPPHKTGKILSAEHRVNMCRLAFSNIKKAELDLSELNFSEKSYTLNTLEFLKEKGIENPILVIGGDSLVDFHKWYKYEEILKMCELMVYKRSSIDDNALLEAKKTLETLGGNIKILDFYPPNISSTEIREKTLKGEDTKEIITPQIANYIKENGLYNGTDF